jgi:hypothetical protein
MLSLNEAKKYIPKNYGLSDAQIDELLISLYCVVNECLDELYEKNNEK